MRRPLRQDALLTLLRALVITKLDFCCSALDGVTGSLMQWLQSVLNAAARLVFSARRSEHTTPLLRELHWLKVTERIRYRLCVLVHRCLHGTGWVTALNHWRWYSSPPQIGQHVYSLCRQLPVHTWQPDISSGWLLLVPGTISHLVSDPQHLEQHSVSNSRQCSFGCPTDNWTITTFLHWLTY